jgi:hypothetical protein
MKQRNKDYNILIICIINLMKSNNFMINNFQDYKQNIMNSREFFVKDLQEHKMFQKLNNWFQWNKNFKFKYRLIKKKQNKQIKL